VWFLHGENSDDPAGWERRVLLAGELAEEWGIPLLVHATALWQAKVAVRAGADVLVHSVYEGPVDDAFLSLAREAGTIYTPTLVVHEGYAQLAARTFDADAYGAALACVDPDTRAKALLTNSLPGRASGQQLSRMRESRARRATTMADNLASVKAAGIPIAMGTDAGNPLTLAGPSVNLEMEAMQAAGMTPMEVLVAATQTGAAAMGRAEDLGTVEPGKIADLVVLGADPLADIRNVRAVEVVVRAGRILRRADLEWR
ncbi:MAG TPA: amidohydrolase family protein, partial [Longimicrobiales bacterium]|nr:amidohydrolase family protein [Longimicrobiales bacterium]